MPTATTWANLSTQSTPNWPVAGLVLAVHAVLLWAITQLDQPAPQLAAGEPLMVRFIEAPPAPEPVTPPTKPAPKIKPVPKPKPQVERPPEPVKRPKPVKKPLIAQTRPKPVPMETAPKPPPRREPVAQPLPKPSPPVQSAPERAPRSAPNSDTAKEAPIIPPNIVAAYRDNPPPDYPMRSRRLGEQGKVLLRVHVNTSGHVSQIKIQRSCGHRRLDRAAVEAVRNWRFAPARRAGQPIAAWVLVPIQFELS